MGKSGSRSDFTTTEMKKMLGSRNLCAVGVKQELIARLMTNDPAGSWMHGHGSNMNRVCTKKDTDVSENSPSSLSKEVDDRTVNILSKKRAESRKDSEGDLITIKPELKFVAKRIILWTVRDIESVAK